MLPFFPPIRGVGAHGFLCQWRLHHRAVDALPAPGVGLLGRCPTRVKQGHRRFVGVEHPGGEYEAPVGVVERLQRGAASTDQVSFECDMCWSGCVPPHVVVKFSRLLKILSA